MSDIPGADSELPPILPLFPLRNTVLFPRMLLPMHISRPHHRAMVRDVKDEHGLIVVARRVGDSFDKLGTVGRVRELVHLEDGSYNLVLEGVQRVSLTEAQCDTPYRQVLVEPRPEQAGSDDPDELEQSKLELLGTLGILLSTAKARVPVVLNQAIPLEVLINKACARLPIDALARQRLLAEDDLLGRQRRVSDYLTGLIESVALTEGEGSNDGKLLN